jgi:hypothetical protein
LIARQFEIERGFGECFLIQRERGDQAKQAQDCDQSLFNKSVV